MDGIISCKDYAAIAKENMKKKILETGENLNLIVIQVGSYPASNAYINGKKKDCEEVGIDIEVKKFNEDVTLKQMEMFIKSEQEKYDGVIVQLPLPGHLDPEKISNMIDPSKDVDGFRRDSLFDCCTPKGIIDWMEFNNIKIEGTEITVIGRSKTVGKPLANMLIDRGATVTSCNSHTDFVCAHTINIPIVISCVGKPKYFDSFHFIGADLVIDVGINRDENGKLCGDVDSSSVDEYTYVTPVPGGVGLLTRVALLQNVAKSHELSKHRDIVFTAEDTKRLLTCNNKENDKMIANNKFNIGDIVYATARFPFKHECPVCEGKGTFEHNGYNVKCGYCCGSGQLHRSHRYVLKPVPVEVKKVIVSFGEDSKSVKYRVHCDEKNIKNRAEEMLFKTLEEAQAYCELVNGEETEKVE